MSGAALRSIDATPSTPGGGVSDARAGVSGGLRPAPHDGLRIVYVSAATIPSRTANSLHVMKMCQAFVQEGHAVQVLAPRRSGALALHGEELWEHYGVSERFEIRKLAARRPLEPLRYGVRAGAAARWLAPDLVYARQLPGAAFAASLGCPTIYETHDVPAGPGGRRYFQMLTRSRRLRGLIAISDGLVRDLRCAFPSLCERMPIVVAPDGVDLERFTGLPEPRRARELLSLGSRGLVAGYSGHLYPGRGIELILELARLSPGTGFLIVGGDPDEVDRRRAAARAMGCTNVTFCGHVPNAAIPQYLAACDVLLMPYQRRVAVSGGGNTAAWMSPLKMFEYMAAGRLIIASDLPVLREVLGEANAVLCPPESVAHWHSALERAAAEPGWRLALGSAARRDAERYSWRRRVRACLAAGGREAPGRETEGERV